MKKFLTLILCADSFLLVTSSQLNAQAYYAFPDSNASWNELCLRTFAEDQTNNLYQQHCGSVLSLAEDTIINSKKYTKIGYQNDWSFTIYKDTIFLIPYNFPINPPGEIFGAIREDSNKMVWFVNFSEYKPICNDGGNNYNFYTWPIDSEMLLYDFNLQLGDTLTFPYYKKVTAIDSIQLKDGSFRKKYTFNYGPEFWIEGIGSSMGLFGPYFQPIPPLDLSGIWLNCFSQNGQFLFEKENLVVGITCDSLNIPILLDIPNLQSPSETSFFNFPNPFSDYTSIQFFLTRPSNISLQIYDMNGRQIKNLFENKMLSGGNHSINFYAENHSPGVYCYLLRSNEKTEVGKMFLLK